jgi:hypothetical protein
LNGIVVSVSGTTITSGTDTVLSSVVWSGTTIDAIKISDNKVLIIHPYEADLYLYSMIVTIDGLNVIAGTDVLLNSSVKSTGKLVSVVPIQGFYSIFHSNSSDYYLHAQNWSLNENATVLTNNMSTVEYEQQVTPAIEPPFDAIALSSGEGASEYVEQEITKTGNMFPTSDWTSTSISRQYASNGYIITPNSVDSYDAYNAFDGNTATFWRAANNRSTKNLKIELPKPVKITKMQLYIVVPVLECIKIQGSNNDSDWVDLKTLYSDLEELTLVILDNPDFYKYYRVSSIAPSNAGATSSTQIREWQTSEYIEKVLTPNTKHNEQVKIARVYREVEVEKTFTGNAFPLGSDSWTTLVEQKSYQSDNGAIVTCTEPSNSSQYAYNLLEEGKYAYKFYAGNSHAIVELPNEIRVSKMSAKLYSNSNGQCTITVYGSKNGTTWNSLWTGTAIAEEKVYEMPLNNIDYYKYYKIEHSVSSLTNFQLAQWKTLEYTKWVTEVIQ